MNKTYTMSIRVTETELGKTELAVKLEDYSSYRRKTALKEADKVIKRKEREDLASRNY